MDRPSRGRSFTAHDISSPQLQSQVSAPTRGPRPKEVPVLELEKLVDREDEDAAFTPVAGNPSVLLSGMSWGPAACACQPQVLSSTRAVSVHSLSDQNIKWNETVSERQIACLGFHQSSKSSYRGQPLNSPPSNPSPDMELLYQTPDSTELSQIQTDANHTRTKKLEAEGLTLEKRKQAVIEQMMVDQLSRAVISDPEQNAVNQFSASARHRRTLHHTMVKTQKSLTENLLSHKLCFHARILSRCGREACRELIGFFFTCDQTLTVYEYRSFGKNRCSALPFITRGVYRIRGRPFCLADFSRGADLRFSTDVPHMSNSLRRLPYLTLRVTDVDEEAKRTLQAHSGESGCCLSEEEISDQKTLSAIQTAVRDRLRGHAIPTLIGLGRRLQSLDLKQTGLVGKGQLRECLMEELGLSQQDFDAVCRVMGQQGGLMVDYAQLMRDVTGEMSEIRKDIFMKAYAKLDPNKTGFISLSDIKKFYSTKASLEHVETLPDMEAKIDFLVCMRDTGGVTKEDVSYAEFEDYYEGLSIEIPGDQEYINILKSTWSI